MSSPAANPAPAPSSGHAAGEGDLPKQYRPADHEPRIWDRWIAAKAFHADPSAVIANGGSKDPFCILIPPPNVTAALHLGHALNNTLQDVLVRAHRMKGFETLWMPGTDHAGIATQAVVEKRLRKEGKLKGALKQAMGREEFVGHVQAFKDEYEAVITGQLQKMGCSCDWDRQRFTMDSVCARAVREAFFILFRDGLIYRGKRLVNWDPALQTAVADDECYEEEVDSSFWYLRYPLVHAHGPTTARERAQGQPAPDDAVPVTWSELAARGYPGADQLDPEQQAWVTVATTRPETYLGDTAVAVNPHDPRAKALRGLSVELPLVGRVIPIIEDAYVVLPKALARDDDEANDPKAEFATGFLKVTPAHDAHDAEIGQRHALPAINMMSPDGRVSDKHGWTDVGDAKEFVGMKMADARKAVAKAFEARGLLESVKPYRQNKKFSDRSKAEIEPYLSDQWYVRVTDDRLAGAALRAMVPDQRHDPRPNDPRPNDPRPNEPRPSGSGSSSPTSRDRQGAEFTHYLITFTTYGTWLHGDTRGSVDRDHNTPATPLLTPDDARHESERVSLQHPPFTLTPTHRPVVAAAIAEVCTHRGWGLRACNVRTNHVHVVVVADQPPERVMNDFKSYATRAMRRADPALPEHVWTRHGSTRYLNTDDSIAGARRYVLEEQGEDLGGIIREDRASTARRGASPLPDGRGSLNKPPPTSRDRQGADDAVRGPLGDGSMRFYPARYAKTFEHWHDNIRDWCISRQLWWGHRIPVWYVSLPTFFAGEPSEPNHPTRVRWLIESVIRIAEHCHVAEDVCARPDAVSTMAPEGAAHGAASVFFVPFSARTPQAQEFLELLCAWRSGNKHDDHNKRLSLNFRDRYGEAAWNAASGLLIPHGAPQDPDVLDTWFSSGLWPLSTMGWPDPALAAKETGIADFPLLLDAFNPSTVLCTAREIITLWVSRMTMFNRYLRSSEVTKFRSDEGSNSGTSEHRNSETPPFRDVFIHAVIQDGEGRKMSKSLGNGVDPLDIIATHGADAMRFTLCQMATNTQDVRLPVVKDPQGRNTSPKFDNGRNFATKLWNAAKFAMEKLATPAPGGTPSAQPTSLPDRWILARLAATIAACDRALAHYEFADYSQACYTFLWNDFCDWYLEAVKPTVAADPAQQAVLRATLDATLRLLHPVMPFVTETIYERFSTVPAAPVAGLSLTPPRKAGLLATAGWPAAAPALADPAAVAAFARVQALVTAVREVKAQHNAPYKRKVTLHMLQADIAALGDHAALVVTLANLEAISPEAPQGPSVVITADAREYRVSNLADQAAVDTSAEKTRLEKVIADLDKSAGTLRGRLNNPGYTDKAPPHMVQQTRDQLAKVETELAAARKALESL